MNTVIQDLTIALNAALEIGRANYIEREGDYRTDDDAPAPYQYGLNKYKTVDGSFKWDVVFVSKNDSIQMEMGNYIWFCAVQNIFENGFQKDDIESILENWDEEWTDCIVEAIKTAAQWINDEFTCNEEY